MQSISTLDASALARITSGTEPAFIKVDLPGCPDCEALQPFWQTVGEGFTGRTWHASCSALPAFCEAQAIACSAARCEPAFLAWSGGRFLRYAGGKKVEALVEWIFAASQGQPSEPAAASSPPRVEPPPAALDREALAACVDEQAECERWAREGECELNVGFMHQACRAACAQCQSLGCHDERAECEGLAAAGRCPLAQCRYSCRLCGVNFKPECRRDPSMPAAAEPGTIDETMARALSDFPQFGPSALHRDPWVLHFDSFMSEEEADALVRRPPPGCVDRHWVRCCDWLRPGRG
jgi:hypothetical protein